MQMLRNTEFKFSAEQQKVLADNSRLRIIQAGPGTGKTTLFAAAIAKIIEVEKFKNNHGLAAITFTRVARSEIERRLGNTTSHPHYIGTLDAFTLRFIVKPFGKIIGVKSTGVKLIPDSRIQNSELFPVNLENIGRISQKIAALNFNFTGGTLDDPTFDYYCKIAKKRKNVDAIYTRAVLKAKKQLWSKTGMLSHSDCQYISFAILQDKSSGKYIVDTLNQRFPYIFVDEAQDTGWFHSQMLLTLLTNSTGKALLVGDPDQAIYEFSGSNSNFFNSLEQISGASKHCLTETRRCHKGITDIISTLSSTNAKITPLSTNIRGNGIIAYYNSEEPSWSASMQKLVEEFAESKKNMSILSRKTSTIYALKGKSDVEAPDKFSLVPRKLFEAEVALRRGDSVRARLIAEQIVTSVVFKKDTKLDQKDLEQIELTNTDWRKAVWNILTECCISKEAESWNAWQDRVREKITSIFKENCHATGLKTIKKKFQNYSVNYNIIKRVTTIAEAQKITSNEFFSTVHGVKGEEFDTVVLFCPKPIGNNCPSKQWWSVSEEKRVAFVAASRAKETFILLVHQKSYESFRTNRAEFFSLFIDYGSIEK
jgi:DNA helicase II / ATP-dependent DNA helicase PcrA